MRTCIKAWILFILKGNDDIHESLNEFEIRPDLIIIIIISIFKEDNVFSITASLQLIQALMYVIITFKYEKDPIKSNREKVATPFLKL